MNYYINILRILEDYLLELAPKNGATEIQDGINRFKEEFVTLRKEIDAQRHEMHILKMKLAAYSREGKTITEETYRSDNHDTLEERFSRFQQTFEQMKQEFEGFRTNWE